MAFRTTLAVWVMIRCSVFQLLELAAVSSGSQVRFPIKIKFPYVCFRPLSSTLREIIFSGEQGVDYLLQHETDHDVNHLQFLVNEGGLITACSNDMIHLWNYRQKTPEVVHSVQLNKESVSAIHLPTGSKWLYVGTDKGNVYFVSVATFNLSSYVINWNKAIDL